MGKIIAVASGKGESIGEVIGDAIGAKAKKLFITFAYLTLILVVKKNRKQGGNFMGLGAYTRANAEVCLLGVTPGFKAKTQIRAHNVHQIIEAPFEGHSKKPDETRQRIVELLGDVPRLEMFARQRADGWDAWGNEAPEA